MPYESLFRYHPDLILQFDTNGILVNSNADTEPLTGYKIEEIIHQCLFPMIEEPYHEFAWRRFQKALQGESQSFEIAIRHKQGHRVYLKVTNVPILADGQVMGVFGVLEDIAAQLRSRELQRQSEEKYHMILESIEDGYYEVDLDGNFTFFNEKLRQSLGYPREKLLGLNYLQYTTRMAGKVKKVFNQVYRTGQSHEVLDWEITTSDGTRRIVEASVSLIRDAKGQAAGFRGIVRDITERKRAEQQIEYMAYHDDLTGLPNRRLFTERLDEALAEGKQSGMVVVVLFLDVDRFKCINDTLGHLYGDQLLKMIADRLKKCVGEKGLVARMGGDEFTVLLPSLQEAEEAVPVAEAILQEIGKPYTVGDHTLYVTTSIGIAHYPVAGDNIHCLMKNADLAMYKAKGEGKNTYKIYDPGMNAKAYKSLVLEHELRQALDLGQLCLEYQPKVSIQTGRMTGVEALVRWNHPQLGKMRPGEFIPLAEETGVIVPIDDWVLRAACRQIQLWRQKGLPSVRLAVNFSALQFLQKDLAKAVASILEETGMSPECLEIEITENTLIQDGEVTLRSLQELKEMGVYLTIDDFGTGYSSLSYLTRFRIDSLKIDGEFIRSLPFCETNRAIVTAIVTLARSLGMRAVAECVETAEQLECLKELQCDEVQGYVFSPPLPAGKIEHLLTGMDLSLGPATGTGD